MRACRSRRAIAGYRKRAMNFTGFANARTVVQRLKGALRAPLRVHANLEK
jgi:hypothetical protein